MRNMQTCPHCGWDFPKELIARSPEEIIWHIGGCEKSHLRAQLAECQRERNEARANYQFMVDRVADEKLDGYRELGQRAADAENRAERLEAAISAAVHKLELSRIWGGNGWHWTAAHPSFIVKPTWEILRAALEDKP